MRQAIRILRDMPAKPAIEVLWTRALNQGQPIDRWFASVEQPIRTFGFAQIERAPEGGWLLIVFPSWTLRDHPEVKTKMVGYQSGKTAKKHLEACAQANWPVLSERWRLRSSAHG